MSVNDFRLRWTNTRMPYFTNGIELNHFENVEIKDFDGTASPINSHAFRIYANDGKHFSTDDNKDVKLEHVE